jgi:hypothetical protein
MATFSLGNSAIVPGAPGVYINERPGILGTPAIAPFSTTYMLVEAEDSVPVTVFPFNKPIAITSINDYKILLGGTIPQDRIALLSYNCVQEFFLNAQVGDLRVVRVGTPAEVIEIELLSSGTKINSTGTPSALMAGDVVYAQMTVNGIPLVSGNNSTGYSSNGEWLGVPVNIPVNYIAGDAVNNRKISAAVVKAVAEAMQSNPSVSSSVYVRSYGMLNDLDPVKYANSQNAYVTISSATWGGNVSVVTQVAPVGQTAVFMQNTYSVDNIVGQGDIAKVPQDYIQCISTAFDGQQDQGYLITPTAYAQFDVEGRSAIGAAAADHCANNSYKWMAIADPGPYNVTDVNKYNQFTPHKAAEDLLTNQKYLVDNAIYTWTGATVTHPRLNYQELKFGVSPETAITESTNTVSPGTKVGILDSGVYIANVDNGATGRILFNNSNYWPVDKKIQKVNVTGAEDATNPFHAINGKSVYLIAPKFDDKNFGDYNLNYAFIALTPAEAAIVLRSVELLGGSNAVTTLPTGAVAFPSGSGACEISYETSAWDFEVLINGQSSDLIQSATDSVVGVNTLHLPATLQSPTTNYRLSFQSRTIYDPKVSVTSSTSPGFAGVAVINCVNHGLTDGQKIYFTQPVTAGGIDVFKATTKAVTFDYFVKQLSVDSFVLSTSLTALNAGSYVLFPSASIVSSPTIFYTNVLGGSETAVNLTELTNVPFLRGRKYGFASGTIDNIAGDSKVAPAPSLTAPKVSIRLNNSAQVLGKGQISAWGENTTAGYLPELKLVDPGDETAFVENFYCVPTTKQSFSTEGYLVPSLQAIPGGDYNAGGGPAVGPLQSVTITNGGTGGTDGQYVSVPVVTKTGLGQNATVTVTVTGGVVNNVTVVAGGTGYAIGDQLELDSATIGGCIGFEANVAGITLASSGTLANVTPYVLATGLNNGSTAAAVQASRSKLVGVYFNVTSDGLAPDDRTNVAKGDRLAAVSDGVAVTWMVVKPDAVGQDENIIAAGQPCYGATVEISFLPEQTPPANLWRFDAITSTNIIDEALRGVGFNGVPQAVFVEAGIDNVTRLLDDSQRYEHPLGFIAYYGPYIQNAGGQWIPPSPYVTGVAIRRYRSEGYQFPPAGAKYQLSDAVAAQIPINSAQQNLLNPKGCNAIRNLPGYPLNSIFIWGGRTRINEADAQQRLYQFVNTRVILNVVYGSLRNAFDNQIFNVVDGFGVVYNQIVNVGNSVLNELYVKGALFGARPSDAFQVICDERINNSMNLESGVVNAKVFVTPVPTLERIQIDLIRVAIGQMQKELDLQGLGTGNR